MTYVKLATKYSKKWHILEKHHDLDRTVCGFGVWDTDARKEKLAKKDQLCRSCMLTRAHQKQKLNRKVK